MVKATERIAAMRSEQRDTVSIDNVSIDTIRHY